MIKGIYKIFMNGIMAIYEGLWINDNKNIFIDTILKLIFIFMVSGASLGGALAISSIWDLVVLIVWR